MDLYFTLFIVYCLFHDLHLKRLYIYVHQACKRDSQSFIEIICKETLCENTGNDSVRVITCMSVLPLHKGALLCLCACFNGFLVTIKGIKQGEIDKMWPQHWVTSISDFRRSALRQVPFTALGRVIIQTITGLKHTWITLNITISILSVIHQCLSK